MHQVEAILTDPCSAPDSTSFVVDKGIRITMSDLSKCFARPKLFTAVLLFARTGISGYFLHGSFIAIRVFLSVVFAAVHLSGPFRRLVCTSIRTL